MYTAAQAFGAGDIDGIAVWMPADYSRGNEVLLKLRDRPLYIKILLVFTIILAGFGINLVRIGFQSLMFPENESRNK